MKDKYISENKKCPRISSEAFTSFIQHVELIKPIQPFELLIVTLGGQLSNRVIVDLLKFVKIERPSLKYSLLKN